MLFKSIISVGHHIFNKYFHTLSTTTHYSSWHELHNLCQVETMPFDFFSVLSPVIYVSSGVLTLHYYLCLQTNTSVASSLGPYFFAQISLIFLDMLTVYRYLHLPHCTLLAFVWSDTALCHHCPTCRLARHYVVMWKLCSVHSGTTFFFSSPGLNLLEDNSLPCILFITSPHLSVVIALVP